MSQPAVRYHSLDALRAIAMLLGILLHAAISYMTRCPEWWPTDDQSRSVVFDLFVFGVHGFRMQVFFLMAGFFASMLLGRRGDLGYVRHRALRIALPLALSVVLILPLCWWVWIVGMRSKAGVDPGVVASLLAVPDMFVRDYSWFHLWFLWYLLFYYAGFMLVGRLLDRALRSSVVQRVVTWTINSPWRVLILAAPTVLLLLPMESGGVDTPRSIMPIPRILAYYAFFFGSGWVLYGVPHLLEQCTRLWKTNLTVALLLVLPAAIVLTGDPSLAESDRPANLPALIASALFTWLMILGLTGLFVSRFSGPSRMLRFVSDSSYWLYLIHLPLVVAMQVALEDVPAPALLKFTGIVLVSSVIMLATYRFCVRYTIIGIVLNGRRQHPPPRPEPITPDQAAPAGGRPA